MVLRQSLSQVMKAQSLKSCLTMTLERLKGFFIMKKTQGLSQLLIIIMVMICTPLVSLTAQKQSSLIIQEVRSEYYRSGSAMIKIRDTEKLLNGGFKKLDLLLSMKSEIVMSDEQAQMLLNGIPLTFVYDIRIAEKGFWNFWGGNHYSKEIRYLLFYHGLSKQFVVRDLETKNQHSYPTLSLALLSISTPSNIEFALHDPEGLKLEDYQGQAKLWLDIEALPTPLRIPAYLSSNWRLNSSWFKWELKL